MLQLSWSNSFLNHRPESPHPENPERLVPLFEELNQTPRWIERTNQAPRNAQQKERLQVHAEEMIQSILATKGLRGWHDPDTYYGPDSCETALLAAGSCIELALKIWNGEHKRGFALVRPPGHHATENRIMGFCLFNNIAVAASAIINESPNARIAIVDFDLHHGNGTQSIFYRNPNVFFISSHRYPFFPGTGSISEIGDGPGKGTTFNYPIPSTMGDSLLIPLYATQITEHLLAFRPEIILVSAGFDGHVDDPMRGLSVSTEGFGVLTRLLIDVAEQCTGKIMYCLEGGYNPLALKESVLHCMDILDTHKTPLTESYSQTHTQSEKLLEFFAAHSIKP